MTTKAEIFVGDVAGHHFYGQADLEVVWHCSRGTQRGYKHGRKRLTPDGRWENDVWFEWFEEGRSDHES